MSKEKGEFILTADVLALADLAKEIQDVSTAFKELKDGPFNQRAIVALLHDALRGKLNRKEIKDVLTVLENLDKVFLKPTSKK